MHGGGIKIYVKSQYFRIYQFWKKHLVVGELSNEKQSKQEWRKHQFNIFLGWWEAGIFFPHCILNEFKTVFRTACEQSRFSGDFVSRRAIVWALWPSYWVKVQCLLALGKRDCYLPLLLHRDCQLHLLSACWHPSESLNSALWWVAEEKSLWWEVVPAVYPSGADPSLMNWAQVILGILWKKDTALDSSIHACRMPRDLNALLCLYIALNFKNKFI